MDVGVESCVFKVIGVGVGVGGRDFGRALRVGGGGGEAEGGGVMTMEAVILLVRVVLVPFVVVLSVGIEEVKVAEAVHNLAEEVGSEMLILLLGMLVVTAGPIFLVLPFKFP